MTEKEFAEFIKIEAMLHKEQRVLPEIAGCIGFSILISIIIWLLSI